MSFIVNQLLNCGRVIKRSEKVEWVDKERKIFKCPECDKEITIG